MKPQPDNIALLKKSIKRYQYKLRCAKKLHGGLKFKMTKNGEVYKIGSLRFDISGSGCPLCGEYKKEECLLDMFVPCRTGGEDHSKCPIYIYIRAYRHARKHPGCGYIITLDKAMAMPVI